MDPQGVNVQIPQGGYYNPAAGQPQGTTVVIQQPRQGLPMQTGISYNAVAEPAMPWNTELCGCCEDIGVCCFGVFCWWCQLCSISGLLKEGMCMPCCFPQFALPMLRTKMRMKYGIQGSLLNDFCVTLWCGSCAQCQMKRQLNSMGVTSASI